MPPNINWKEIIKVDPDELPRQEELADNLLISLSKVEVNELKSESQENMIHLFRITQSLMKMKAQEVELALEEVEKAGEEQAKFVEELKLGVTMVENIQNILPSLQWKATIQVCRSSPQIKESSSQNNDDLNWTAELPTVA